MATQSEANPLTTIEMRGDDNPLEHAYKRFGLSVIGVAFLLTLLYGVFVAEPAQRMAALMAAFLAAAAPFAVGGLVGFLFGIPRTLQDSSAAGPGQIAGDTPAPAPGAAPAATGTAGALGRRASQDNTNLEQISDWLTKIIVGIGLTQLTQLPAMIQSTGEYIAAAISPHAPTVIGSLILVVFSISGFLVAYLLTKADLAREIDLRRQRDRLRRSP